MTLVSEDEAEPIHSAIVRKEAWTQDAASRLRAEAEKRMRETPGTIPSERPNIPELDPHDYYSEAPAWWPNPEDPAAPWVRREGQINPNRFTANRNSLNALCDSVLTLGAAAFFLDDRAYAQKAARLVNVWFVNPRTRMNPNLEHAHAIPGLNQGRFTGIMEGRALIRAIQGMEFLAQTRAWDARDQAAVRRWFEQYLGWLNASAIAEEARKSGGPSASWWTAGVAAAATLTENQGAMDMAFQEYREHIFPRQIRGEVAAVKDAGPGRPAIYATSNLEAFATICRIAQVQGVDLWGTHTRNGLALTSVIDKIEPTLRALRATRRETDESLYFLAFAGMGLKRPDYVDLFRSLERPEGAWYTLVQLLAARWEAAGHQTRH